MAESDLVERLQLGDHVCWSYTSDDARDRICAAYVRDAVRAHHAMQFAYGTPPEQCLAALESQGIDVDPLVSTGQLKVLSAQEFYLDNGSGPFDPDATIGKWSRAGEEAKAAGFDGFRVLGDMGWATGPTAGGERLSWYEARVTRVFAEGFAIGLCLYDLRLFDHAQVTDVQIAHPAAVNPADPTWDPQLRVLLDDEGGLRLDGESDLSNRGALLAMLERLAETTRGSSLPTVDVSSLRFADVATAGSLLMVALRLGGLRVLGASALLTRLLSLLGADRVPGLVLGPSVVR